MKKYDQTDDQLWKLLFVDNLNPKYNLDVFPFRSDFTDIVVKYYRETEVVLKDHIYSHD